MAIKIKNFKLRLPNGDVDLMLPSEGGSSIDEEVIEQIQQNIKDATIYNESLTLTENEKKIARNNINAAEAPEKIEVDYNQPGVEIEGGSLYKISNQIYTESEIKKMNIYYKELTENSESLVSYMDAAELDEDTFGPSEACFVYDKNRAPVGIVVGFKEDFTLFEEQLSKGTYVINLEGCEITKLYGADYAKEDQVVLLAPQDLTESEKETVRNNIDAISYNDILFPDKEKFKIEENNIIYSSNGDAEIDLNFLWVSDTIYSKDEILEKGAIITIEENSSENNKIYDINGYIKDTSQEEKENRGIEHNDDIQSYMIFNQINDGNMLGFIIISETPNSTFSIAGQEYMLANIGIYTSILKNGEINSFISGFYNVQNKLVTAAEVKKLVGSDTNSAQNKIYIGSEEPSTDEYDIWYYIPEVSNNIEINAENNLIVPADSIENGILTTNGLVENNKLFI